MTLDWHSRLLPSAVEAIGETPLVELSRLVARRGAVRAASSPSWST